jgi:hypothetical protein
MDVDDSDKKKGLLQLLLNHDRLVEDPELLVLPLGEGCLLEEPFDGGVDRDLRCDDVDSGISRYPGGGSVSDP